MTLLSGLAILPWLTNPGLMPGLFHGQRRARDYVCVPLSEEEGTLRYPGQVARPPPRGDYFERSVVVCTERLLREGLREAGDEAILSQLGGATTELAGAAVALRPDLHDRTWLVEVHYPNPQVAAKIGVASKAALVTDGRMVSDRLPTLAVGDVDVLTRLPPTESYAAACSRYRDNGSLRAGDALLAVIQRDPRETILHAGVCADGGWAWLR